jgi:hypothetical protein
MSVIVPLAASAPGADMSSSLFIRPVPRAALRGLGVALFIAGLVGCTQETQNEIRRGIQNWTGTNGVLEVYAGDKVIKRFIKIDKMSTAYGTDDSNPRPYRYGYGVLDENLNGQQDEGEKRVYFEVSDYSTPYVFFESPR